MNELINCDSGQVEVAGANVSVVRAPGELRRVLLTNLTAFTLYSVTVTAFTGHLEDAITDGMASLPALIRTQEEGEEGVACDTHMIRGSFTSQGALDKLIINHQFHN